MKFASRVWNLKLFMATGGNLNPPNVKVRADAPNNISVYELWGNEDSIEQFECQSRRGIVEH